METEKNILISMIHKKESKNEISFRQKRAINPSSWKALKTATDPPRPL